MSQPTKPPTASEFMQDLNAKLQALRTRTEGINASFIFDIEGEDPGIWTVEANDGSGRVIRGAQETADCTVYMNDDVLIRLGTHQLDGGEAYLSGLLTVSGDVSKAMLLAQIFGD
jgi:putative sterol carrier protein